MKDGAHASIGTSDGKVQILTHTKEMYAVDNLIATTPLFFLHFLLSVIVYDLFDNILFVSVE